MYLDSKSRVTGIVGTAVLAAAGLVSWTVADAHHSFAMFDKSHTVTINGTIKDVEWNNPHVWIWVTVPKDGGGSDDWGLESGGPSQLNRMGIHRTMLKTGDSITVDVYPMKDGRIGGEFSKATLSDGTKIDMMKNVKAFAAGGETVQESGSK